MNAINISIKKIDELGLILSTIKSLEEKAEKIKKEIKESASLSGPMKLEGNLYIANYIESNRKVTNWANIAKICNIPEQVIVDNTTVSAVYTLKVTAR